MLERTARVASLLAMFVNTMCDGGSVESTEEQALGNNTALFIDGLKQVLRKDNDDYAELAAGDRGGSAEDTGPLEDNTVDTNDTHPARRSDHGNNRDESTKTALSTSTSSTTRRHHQNRPPKMKRLKKSINKEESLQKFLRKNEGLIRNFLSSRNLLSNTPSTSSRPSLSSSTTPPYNTPFSSLSESMSLSRLITRKLSSPRARSSHPKLLVPPSSGSSVEDQTGTELRQLRGPNELALPVPDQLDMAPASGAKIHNLRIKGRLCQRSVLFPEGPKYDSNGKAYIRAHDDVVAHRDFADTRRPKYLLPRCCNCCRKSVLGCE